MKLRIEKAIYGGATLARVPADGPADLAGKAVFVPLALPGELVEAAVVPDPEAGVGLHVVAGEFPQPGPGVKVARVVRHDL